MPQSARPVNTPSTDEFLNLFPGQHFFRAIHPITKHTVTPGYGEYWEFEPDLQALNDQGYGIYFTANDCPAGTAESVQSLRCIYQDADSVDFAANEPTIGGQLSHASWRTSEGRYQRIWLTDALSPDLQAHIHQFMVERHHHDRQCHGAQRLLRLPGYRNTKYPDKPFVDLLCFRPELPLLTDTVFFGDPTAGDPNTMSALDRPQRGDSFSPKVHDLQRERALRGLATDRGIRAEQDHKAITGTPSGNLPVNELLETLARIDPDCTRDEKLRVFGALHYMGDGEDWAEDIAERWGNLGAHFKPGNFAALWRSLKGDHDWPAHWDALKGRAAACKPDDPEAMSRRISPTFKDFEATHPLGVPYRALVIQWPDQIRVGESMQARLNSPKNARKLLEMVGYRISYDAFAKEILVNDVHSFEEHHLKYLQTTAHEHKWGVSTANLDTYIETIARNASFNKPLSYFESLKGKWDGKERLRNCLQRLLGTPETGYEGQTFELMLVACVRRVREPGIKYDLMPLFEGRQGDGKGSLLERICPDPDWYIGDLKLDAEDKRLYQLMQGKIIVEFAELSGKSEAKIDKIKAFITNKMDKFVANHARRATKYPRIACCAGSTNKRFYLKDTTGNRRFPPLIVTKRLNWAELDAEKEQLWAEAVWIEAMGDVFYPTLTLPDECFGQMRSVQEDRIDAAVGVMDILNELDELKAPFIQDEALWLRLGIPFSERQLRNRSKQAINEIKDLLTQRGWTIQATARVDGKDKKGHFKREKGKKLREIVYNGQEFVYANASEQEDLLS